MLEQQAAAQAWGLMASASQVSSYVSPEFLIARHLLSIKEVESLYIHTSQEMTRVWTVVDDPPEQVFDAIYDRERVVIRELAPDRFDFHVVARKGRPLRSVLTLGYCMWMRR
jgi:hypothetical protein